MGQGLFGKTPRRGLPEGRSRSQPPTLIGLVKVRIRDQKVAAGKETFCRKPSLSGRAANNQWSNPGPI